MSRSYTSSPPSASWRVARLLYLLQVQENLCFKSGVVNTRPAEVCLSAIQLNSLSIYLSTYHCTTPNTTLFLRRMTSRHLEQPYVEIQFILAQHADYGENLQRKINTQPVTCKGRNWRTPRLTHVTRSVLPTSCALNTLRRNQTACILTPYSKQYVLYRWIKHDILK
jgi:hypothetical protein